MDKALILVVILLLSNLFAVQINDSYSTSSARVGKSTYALYYSPDKLAIRGYDPVAYFSQNKATKGLSELAYEWSGVKWLFSTEENRSRFVGNPFKFTPQYGGYSAYAMTQGYTAKTEPKIAWTIYKNKLYLHYDLAYQKKWRQKKMIFIQKANKFWKDLVPNPIPTK